MTRTLPNNWNQMTGPEQFKWLHANTVPGETCDPTLLPEDWSIHRPLKGQSRLTIKGTTYRIKRDGGLAA